MPLKIIIFIYFHFATMILANDTIGKELFAEANCMACHIEDDFSKRKDKSKNFVKLHNSVTACAFGNDVGWFDDEALDVSKYLNKNYYNFKEKD